MKPINEVKDEKEVNEVNDGYVVDDHNRVNNYIKSEVTKISNPVESSENVKELINFDENPTLRKWKKNMNEFKKKRNLSESKTLKRKNPKNENNENEKSQTATHQINTNPVIIDNYDLQLMIPKDKKPPIPINSSKKVISNTKEKCDIPLPSKVRLIILTINFYLEFKGS